MIPIFNERIEDSISAHNFSVYSNNGQSTPELSFSRRKSDLWGNGESFPFATVLLCCSHLLPSFLAKESLVCLWYCSICSRSECSHEMHSECRELFGCGWVQLHYSQRRGCLDFIALCFQMQLHYYLSPIVSEEFCVMQQVFYGLFDVIWYRFWWRQTAFPIFTGMKV